MKIGRKFNQISKSEYFHYIDNNKKYTDFNTLGMYRSICENKKLELSDQIEILRVLSNIIIVIGIILFYRGHLSRNLKYAGISSIIIYTVLNTVFIILNGVTNSISGGLRIPLIFLVMSTIILSATTIFSKVER